jgi:hypothetical protein
MSTSLGVFRNTLVAAIYDLIDSGVYFREDGAIDKDRLEAAVLAALQAELSPESYAELRARAMKFTVYEMTRWVIRNRTRSGDLKGLGAPVAGAREFFNVPGGKGRGWTAKRLEDLSADELEAALAATRPRSDALARERDVLRVELQRRQKEDPNG